MTETEVSALLGIRKGTLKAWRSRGKGPPFVQVGTRTPRYRRSDLEAWLATRTVAVAQ